MSIPVIRQPAQSLMFERLMQDMNVSHGDTFTACRRLLALVEGAAAGLNEVDRVQVSRLMSSTAHAIYLTCEKRRDR
jgi:hypothetical protein